ncbi:unnamed protein product [Malus baccata var. baccata]
MEISNIEYKLDYKVEECIGTTIRLAILYDMEYWAVKEQNMQKMSVTKMKMLRWMCGHIKNDRIKNEDI